MSFVRIETRGEKQYAYEITSYWDKKLKYPKQKKRYLGVVIDKNKKIYEKRYPRKSPERMIVDFGDVYVLEQFFQKNGFTDLLSSAFNELSVFVQLLIHFRLCYPSAMRFSQKWYEGNYARIKYANVPFTSQRISDCLKSLGKEDLQRKFFSSYLSQFSQTNDGIIIDATSLPNQIHIPLTAWGRSGEEVDKQIRFLLVVDKKCEEPLFFRHYAGNIVDVSTLHNTIAELKKLGVKQTYVYLDAGYFSEDNIQDLCKENIQFLTRLPSIRYLYKKLIRSEIAGLESPANVIRYGKRALFIKQKKISLFGHTAYAHIVLDLKRKAREMNKIMVQIADEKEKQDLNNLEYQFKTKGVMILVSSFPLNKKDVVPAYYVRQTAEKMFGFSKDDLEALPLRVHTEKTLQGLLFLQFLALIAYVKLKKELGKKYTVEELLLTMRNLKGKVYDDEILVGEITKQQRLLSEKMGILVPRNVGI